MLVVLPMHQDDAFAKSETSTSTAASSLSSAASAAAAAQCGSRVVSRTGEVTSREARSIEDDVAALVADPTKAVARRLAADFRKLGQEELAAVCQAVADKVRNYRRPSYNQAACGEELVAIQTLFSQL